MPSPSGELRARSHPLRLVPRVTLRLLPRTGYWVLGTGYRIIVAGTAPIGADGSSVAASAYAQTQRCIAIMLDSLSPLGGSASDVAQTRMFITDPSDDDIGRAHGEAFAAAPPAAPLVVVAGLLAPRWRIEMEREAICAQ